MIGLENQTLRLEFDEQSGALTSLAAVQRRWKILDRPNLGLSFRLLVPLSEERRNNPVYGEKQKLAGLEVSPDGQRAVFIWDKVNSEVGGVLPIRFTLEVALTERQAVFTPVVENQSDYIVENVYCPYLGDLQHPAGEAWFKTFLYNYASCVEWSLWPTYQNLRGYHGVDYPVQFHPSVCSSGAPVAPFILLRSQSQGLYAGVSQVTDEWVAWHTELRLRYGSSIDERAR
jgi:hypothetical protein